MLVCCLGFVYWISLVFLANESAPFCMMMVWVPWLFVPKAHHSGCGQCGCDLITEWTFLGSIYTRPHSDRLHISQACPVKMRPRGCGRTNTQIHLSDSLLNLIHFCNSTFDISSKKFYIFKSYVMKRYLLSFEGVFSICCPPVWCRGRWHTHEGATWTLWGLLLWLLAAVPVHAQPPAWGRRELTAVCKPDCHNWRRSQKVLWISGVEGQRVLLS